MTIVGVLVTSGAGYARSSLPTLYGAVRPAVWINGDGSGIAGGLDGTGEERNEGRIRWVRWTPWIASGWAVWWERCLDAHGCPRAYVLASRQQFRMIASDPAHGRFLHLRVGSSCVLTQGYPGFGDGTVAVSCRTWRPR
jgi:hypothetical protein